MHPLLKITRPALAPTAAADVLAAAALLGGAAPERLVAATLASVCLYAGGMAQNDLCDRKRDQTLHPDRPLPSGAVSLLHVRLLVLSLFAAGVVFAVLADVLTPALWVVGLATAYNLVCKRHFPFDVITMGGARAFNLYIGFHAAGGSWTGHTTLGPAWNGIPILYATGYFIYIAAVSGASRAEDMEPPATRRLAVFLAFWAQVAAAGALVFLNLSWLMLIPVVLLTAALVPALRAGTRPAAKRYVLRSLLCIFALHGSALAAAGATDGLIGVFACAGVTFLLLGLR